MVAIRALFDWVRTVLGGVCLLPSMALVLWWAPLYGFDSFPLLLGTGLVGYLFFALWGRHRRRVVVVLFVGAWLVDQTRLLDYRSNLLVAWALGCVLGIVLIEVVRENAGLLWRLLRELGWTPFTRQTGQAFWRWVPMLVATSIGVTGNFWLYQEAERAVYRLTPVDEYCEGQPLVPCEGIVDSAPEPTRLGVEESLRIHWQTRFALKQVSLLDQIVKDEPDRNFLERSQLDAMLARLSASVQTTDVLSLELPDPRPLTAVLAQDASLAQLKDDLKKLQQAQAVRVTFSKALNRLRIVGLQMEQLTPETRQSIAELTQKIKTREAILRSTFRLLPAPSPADIGSVALQLSKSLPKVGALKFEPAFLAEAPTSTRMARAALVARVMQLLLESEEGSLEAALKVVRAAEQFHRQDPRRIIDVVRQLEGLNLPLMCTYERPSDEVSATDSGAQPVPINTATFRCDTQIFRQAGRFKSLGLEKSIDASIQHWQRTNKEQLERESRRMLAQAADKTRLTRDQALQMSALVPATIRLGRERCRLLEGHTWGNCAKNYAKRKAEDAYASGRAEADAEFRVKLRDAEKGGLRSAASQILLMREAGLRDIDQAAIDLQASVPSARTMLDSLNAVLLFLLVVSLVKSLLYSLGLRYYARGGRPAIQIDESFTLVGAAPKVAPVDYRQRSLSIEDVTDTRPLITAEYLENQAQRNARLPPWPLSGTLSRLLHLRYFFYDVGGPMPGKTIRWNAGEGRSIVAWQLEPGEAVVFHYRYFVGASRNVELQSRISFRLDRMLFGRFTYPVAVARDGPGYLLLSARSIDPQAVANDRDEAVMPERLVAWHASTQFQVESKPTMAAVFFDPYSLYRERSRQPGGRMVVDVTPVKASLHGAFRYALKALSPF